MAGALKLRTIVNLTGLGDEVPIDAGEVTMAVPITHQEGYTVCGTTAIQLFDMVDHIALDKIYGVYLEAVVDAIYIAVDTSGTGSLTNSTADLVLNEGEACWLPINPEGNLGLVIDGDETTSACKWMIVGKA